MKELKNCVWVYLAVQTHRKCIPKEETNDGTDA